MKTTEVRSLNVPRKWPTPIKTFLSTVGVCPFHIGRMSPMMLSTIIFSLSTQSGACACSFISRNIFATMPDGIRSTVEDMRNWIANLPIRSYNTRQPADINSIFLKESRKLEFLNGIGSFTRRAKTRCQYETSQAKMKRDESHSIVFRECR